MHSSHPPIEARVIADQFPDLAPVHVTYLGEGYDSTAFDVNGSWVFRFPKRTDVEAQLLIELRVLPVLAPRLPISVPVPSRSGRPAADSPRRFAGYRKLPGTPGIHLDPKRVPFAAAAPALGRFLAALHAFPLSDAQRLGVPAYDSATMIAESRAEALEDFPLVRDVARDAPHEAWYAWLAAGPHAAVTTSSLPVLVHNDLAAEHVLCDPGTGLPTGVIDWSDMALGDPAADFAGIFHWGGEPFAKAVLAHYDGHLDEGVLGRARFLAACRGVGDVRFGIDMNRREYVTAGIRALQMCAH